MSKMKDKALSDSLRAERSGDRIPVEARFSTPVQTGPGAHPASYTMGTGSFQGVKRPGRGVDHPPPSSPFVTCSRVNFTFALPFYDKRRHFCLAVGE